MKKSSIKWLCLACVALVLAPLLALAQTVIAPAASEWEALFVMLGGLKGASSLAIAAALVQAVMLLFRTQLGEKTGQYRMIVMLLLTLISSILAQKIAGVNDFAAILSNTAVLAAGQNFIHQLWTQFVVKSE
jgi:hypothetical protein